MFMQLFVYLIPASKNWCSLMLMKTCLAVWDWPFLVLIGDKEPLNPVNPVDPVKN
jgi:hypothetical protein